MVPIATLEVVTSPKDPPNAISCHVQVEGKTVAVVSVESVKRAYERYVELSYNSKRTRK